MVSLFKALIETWVKQSYDVKLGPKFQGRPRNLPFLKVNFKKEEKKALVHGKQSLALPYPHAEPLRLHSSMSSLTSGTFHTTGASHMPAGYSQPSRVLIICIML